MSVNKTFRPPTGNNNELWQKNIGDNQLVQLISSQANSIFIQKNITVGNTITVTSSEHLKKNIKPLENDDKILNLTPKEYIYKNDEENNIHYGMIAEEVEEIYPNLVSIGSNDVKSINYLEIVPLLLIKIKDLQKQIDELKK